VTVSRIPNVEGGIQPTIVTAKGDLIAAVANASPARLGVGSDGTELRADSTAATGLSWANNFAAGKNKILNSDFSIWQRGTSFTPTNGSYTADRWQNYFNGTGTKTYSQQAFTPGAAPVAGYEGSYFIRLNQSVAGTGATFNEFNTSLESVTTLAGQSATFSFWAKAAATTVLPSIFIRQVFGSGGSPSASVETTLISNLSISTSWTRYSVSFTVPSISGKTLGTTIDSSYLQILTNLPLNSTFTIDIWGVQLEQGSIATAFQTATGNIQSELAACQRHYYRANANGAAYGNTSIGGGNSATSYWGDTYFPVTMRKAPVAIDTSTPSNYRIFNYADTVAGTPSAITIDTNITTANVGRTIWTTSGLTANVLYYSRGNNTASSYLGFSADL
jgi:hypothetical protein